MAAVRRPHWERCRRFVRTPDGMVPSLPVEGHAPAAEPVEAPDEQLGLFEAEPVVPTGPSERL